MIRGIGETDYLLEATDFPLKPAGRFCANDTGESFRVKECRGGVESSLKGMSVR